ncbi:hypothetical protein [Microbispora sp. KK1-11]|nr:hypothetical protein [Microbispora sp. KK1-11]
MPCWTPPPRPRRGAARGEDPGAMTMFPETAEQARALGGRHGATTHLTTD